MSEATKTVVSKKQAKSDVEKLLKRLSESKVLNDKKSIRRTLRSKYNYYISSIKAKAREQQRVA